MGCSGNSGSGAVCKAVSSSLLRDSSNVRGCFSLHEDCGMNHPGGCVQAQQGVDGEASMNLHSYQLCLITRQLLMMTASVAEGRAVNTDFFFFFTLARTSTCSVVVLLWGNVRCELNRLCVNYVEHWLDCQTQGAVGNCEQV